MKLECEGYSARAQMDEQKWGYEMEVYNREYISLDPSKISKHPGKRSLAKLMLNSFWRKFGQQNNKDKTIIYNAPKEFFELVMNIVNIIKYVRLINEQLVSSTYCQHDDFAEVMALICNT
uniref:DNA-directed DNA polymerase n=1 Tax=Romanomermis culicivorax TaxID=13658 RepID=A0A915K640_ROMCU